MYRQARRAVSLIDAGKPYEPGTDETMRIMAALYYFSDYFGQH